MLSKERNDRPFMVKIKSGRWWYTKLVGKDVEVTEFSKTGSGRFIPYYAKTETIKHKGRDKQVPCEALAHVNADGQTCFIHKEDVELLGEIVKQSGKDK